VTPDGHQVDMRMFENRTVAGKYLLREHLGSGGFGGVFRSDQYVLGSPLRRVALKLSRTAGMSADNVRDVLADAFLLAEAMDTITDQESRVHLVHIYDAGIAADLDDRWFLTMEYVSGTTLEDQFGSFGRVPAGQVVKWSTQVCRALRGLHRLTPPLLHRDLKPSNVLLGTDNVVRVVDFGLAARMVHLGHTPGTVGVLDHMSPETAVGRSSPASDVYSLGVLVYQGLTGGLPFRTLVPPGDLPDAMHGEWLSEAKRRFQPAPPSKVNSTVSGQLDDVVLTCLAFDPNQRFADAGELLDTLTALGDDTTRPVDRARDEGRARRAVGEFAEALRALDRGLALQRLTRDEQFWLHRDRGEVLGLMDDPARAAAAFVAAWQLTERSALLRTVAERVALLDQIIASYRGASNSFQVRRYEALRGAELRGGA
jgi:serine/threonine protein kinase